MILVTGGTGLVGSYTILELLKKGESIRALYRSEEKKELTKKVFGLFDANHLFDKIEWFKADISDVPKLTEAFNGISIVYHCAALISFNPSDRRKLKKNNIEATANMVNLSIENNIKKFCYVSSVATLGKPIEDRPISEKDHWNPEASNNVYAISKYRSEMEVWRGSQEGLDVIVVNPGIVLGPSFFESGSGKFHKLLKSGLRFYPAGSTGFIKAEEVSKLMVQITESDIGNERFILVTRNCSYKEVIDDIAQKEGYTPPTKILKPWLLGLLWRLDWLVSIVTNNRKLTKNTARSLSNHTRYSNEKLKDFLAS